MDNIKEKTMDDIEVNTMDAEVFKVEERCKEYTDEKVESLVEKTKTFNNDLFDIVEGFGNNLSELANMVVNMYDKYNFRMFFLSIILAGAIVAFVIVSSISSARINSLENEVNEYKEQVDNLVNEKVIDDDTISFNTRAGITEVISNGLRNIQ